MPHRPLSLSPRAVVYPHGLPSRVVVRVVVLVVFLVAHEALPLILVLDEWLVPSSIGSVHDLEIEDDDF